MNYVNLGFGKWLTSFSVLPRVVYPGNVVLVGRLRLGFQLFLVFDGGVLVAAMKAGDALNAAGGSTIIAPAF